MMLITLGVDGPSRLNCDGMVLLSVPSDNIFWHVSMSECRQVGHEECDLNHLSTHWTWKPWLHFGSIFTFSSEMNSLKQIVHSLPSPGSFNPSQYLTIGKVFNTFFLIPVFANLASVCSWLVMESVRSQLEHRSTHLMIEFSAKEQRRAHKSTERTMITFASKLLLTVYGLVEGETAAPCCTPVLTILVVFWFMGTLTRSFLELKWTILD
ncbi:hypothetical protein R6Q59_035345 [Mikania micrantha]|uniref:Uncharacterized protein n=1 Tax=Mikania micrantha TaxID=192012 RepID=A0A5N6NH67_9ASTR|nr:hypothetical protein E3N88_23926 [Mikania micrantha]